MQSAWNVLRQRTAVIDGSDVKIDAIRMERAEAKNRQDANSWVDWDAIRMERAEAKRLAFRAIDW